jgi:hypothetical protein
VDINDIIYVELCGTTDGDQATCNAGSVPSGCEDVDGKGQSSHLLDIDEPRALFCMQEFHGLLIKGTPVGTVDLVLTCQYGQLNPQSVNIQFTSSGSKYFEITDSCVVSSCD